MASLDHDEPITWTNLRGFAPGDPAIGADDRDPVVVRRLQRQAEFRFNRIHICKAVVLRNQGGGVSGAVEDLLSCEVLPHGRGIQKMPEGFEPRRRPHEAGGGNAASLLHGLRGGVEDPHERYRAGGDPHRALHEIALRTQAGDPKPRLWNTVRFTLSSPP